jgi:RNA polymerase sigma-70 factor (ECF subfamily)
MQCGGRRVLMAEETEAAVNERRSRYRDELNGRTDAPARAAQGTRSGMTWPPTLSFETALLRAKALDERCLSLLYARFLLVVYRFHLARVGDPYVAEDLTAETFIAMVEEIAQARATEELSFAAWLLGIARNKLLMYLRARRSRPAPVYGVPDEFPLYTRGDEADPLEVLTARESWHDIVAALNTLSEEQRTVVLYRCVLGYSAEEVGELLGKQAGAVRAVQFRALASLARRLGAQDAASPPVVAHHPPSAKGRTHE